MIDNRTTELLEDYAFALRRLEYDADKPGSNMTLGEYEAGEKRVTDEYAQAIAATLGGGKLTAEQLRDAINELQKKQPYCYDPDKPLDTLKTIGRYIGELESTVLRMYREHPIAQFEQWIEDLGLNEADAWKPRTLGSEREKALEELVRSLYADYYSEWPDRAEEAYAERMKELGIEVIDQ